MERLDLETLDLLLIHWPAPALDRYLETWRAFESLYADGRVRAIGVSNFGIDHLQRLMRETTVVPAINQVELHPMLAQDALRAFHSEHGVVTESWAPLARGQLQADPTIVAIAHRTGKTPAQVILRWQMELGNVAIPKSVTASRIAENIDVFDFSSERRRPGCHCHHRPWHSPGTRPRRDVNGLSHRITGWLLRPAAIAARRPR